MLVAATDFRPTPRARWYRPPVTQLAGGRCPHNVLDNAKLYGRTLFCLELRAKVGVCGLADTNGRDVHVVYGGEMLRGKPWTDSNESFHTWLEDSNGLIYDHVSSHLVQLEDICGADTSRVTTKQRLVGVSREKMFRKFGVWYESHPEGTKCNVILMLRLKWGLRNRGRAERNAGRMTRKYCHLAYPVRQCR